MDDFQNTLLLNIPYWSQCSNFMNKCTAVRDVNDTDAKLIFRCQHYVEIRNCTVMEGKP